MIEQVFTFEAADVVTGEKRHVDANHFAIGGKHRPAGHAFGQRAIMGAVEHVALFDVEANHRRQRLAGALDRHVQRIEAHRSQLLARLVAAPRRHAIGLVAEELHVCLPLENRARQVRNVLHRHGEVFIPLHSRTHQHVRQRRAGVDDKGLV